MARKTVDVTVDTGRDAGKTFRITEMPAVRAERWAMRAILAVGRGGYHMPDSFVGGGMMLLASIGFATLLRTDPLDAEPLLDEMLTCIEFVADTGARPVVWDGMGPDVEEVATMLRLRDEVAALHVGFSPIEKLRTWGLDLKAQLESNLIPTSEI